MVENVKHITSEYEERLRRYQYVPRLSFGRLMLTDDGAPNRFFLMYLFCNESMAIQWESVCDYKVVVVVPAEFRNQVRQCTIIIILRLDFVLFFLNNLSPILPFHSFFMFLHSCYARHP